MTSGSNGAGKAADTALVPIGQDLLGAVHVTIEARLGSTMMTAAQVMALKTGTIVTLTTGIADHVELFLNGAAIARGEIVAVDDQFGVRIVEIAP